MNPIHLEILQSCQDSLVSLEKMMPIDRQLERVAELDTRINAPGLWNYPKEAAALMKERKQIHEIAESIVSAKEDLGVYDVVIKTGDLGDTDFANLLKLNTKLQSMVFKAIMCDPADNTPAIISIGAGAGGLESANFVTMLLRMYSRFADSNGFSVEILDEKQSEEHSTTCLDSVSIRVSGPYAYGFFKAENGVHRLIRNSPFNAANARETSFAAVNVTPDIEDTINIKIDEKDLEITAQTAGGPGGQHQNKVSSAVRLKHIPSGINILVRTERDQHANKRTAFKMLKSRLYDLEMKKRKAEQDTKVSQQMEASFGSQIRTITLSPYSLVKDHRTGYEDSNATAVLDGDIKSFMLAYLEHIRQ